MKPVGAFLIAVAVMACMLNAQQSGSAWASSLEELRDEVFLELVNTAPPEVPIETVPLSDDSRYYYRGTVLSIMRRLQQEELVGTISRLLRITCASQTTSTPVFHFKLSKKSKSDNDLEMSFPAAFKLPPPGGYGDRPNPVHMIRFRTMSNGKEVVRYSRYATFNNEIENIVVAYAADKEDGVLWNDKPIYRYVVPIVESMRDIATRACSATDEDELTALKNELESN